jgi:hypothetical protein
MGWDEAWAATRRAAGAVTSAAHSSSRAGAGAARKTSGVVHRMTGASGAGRTGLANLIELTAISGAGDAFVTIGLAGTLFFSTSLDAARGRVALTLLITMAPFAVLAPVLGPALDRAQSGRRYLLAGTLLARGLLCFAMVDAVLHSDVLSLLPAAFGVLVLQKAYAVTRAAITPRLLPKEITLVAANARTGMASLVAGTVAGLLALGVSYIAGGGAEGAAWTLRVGTLVYIAATAMSFRVPDHVDIPESKAAQDAGQAPTVPTPAPVPPARRGQPGTVPYAAQTGRGGHPAPPPDARGGSPTQPEGHPARAAGGGRPPTQTAGGRRPGQAGGPGGNGTRALPAAHHAPPPGRNPGPARGNGNGKPNGSNGKSKRAGFRTLREVGPVVGEAMRANAALRAFSGFMIFFLAFLLRTVHFHGVNDKVALASMVICATAGGFLGSAVGSAMRARRPYLITFGMLTAATVITAACASFFGLWAALVVALVAAFGQVLAKLALDSTVQNEIGEEVRSSAFAVSETLHQLSWVAGGLAGIAMSFTSSGIAGLAFCAVGLGAALVYLLVQRRHRHVEAGRPQAQAVM